jgi:hypothetical protein
MLIFAERFGKRLKGFFGIILISAIMMTGLEIKRATKSFAS